MNILVTYDIADTESKAGAKRLRKVAIVCKDYGQRVQFSVFECEIDQMQFEVFRSKLLKTIDVRVDSLRFYKLMGGRDRAVEAYGVDKYVDFNEPLIL
ncbi:CRISPR-associated endonuclease Cas2 [Chamaesiphon minutus]|uniref:CRISPR-associated endoribonuclease Cas2 n=1 Tax=Chamaesiphon minutus (strain ATCC 27169 / PCC 6605) TaxID=1173020 RepID=K9UEQ3_CHAP6|nr:CRISPR-associated endonuclease Cas2 [Chamaesiphon minutus]AFY93133.1 CRISPR-associated endoribonuclease Cas2 [Chamaesiphon minutus PCC 6605]